MLPKLCRLHNIHIWTDWYSNYDSSFLPGTHNLHFIICLSANTLPEVYQAIFNASMVTKVTWPKSPDVVGLHEVWKAEEAWNYMQN